MSTEYRAITPDELKTVLAEHAKWLKDSSNGKQADLSSADLSYANLSSADLSYANLSSADLSYANLSYANLSSADLRSANLRSANLRSADLRSANLSSADLCSANLSYANLSSADLRSANLLIFQFQRHTAYFTLDGSLRIGCHVMPISEWVIGYEEIGKCEGYTEQQIKLYGQFIQMCVNAFNNSKEGI